MTRNVFSLKFDRSSKYAQNTILVYNLHQKPILYKGHDDAIINHIVDSIVEHADHLLKQYNISRQMIETKLVCNKWQTMYFRNNNLNREGVFKLESIKLS